MRLLARIVAKIVSYDRDSLRFQLRGPFIFGPADRLIVGRQVDLQTSYLNTVGGRIVFKDLAFCGEGCMFLTGTHNHTSFGLERHAHVTSGRDILIGEGVWVGSGAIILGGVTIADHAVIAAGAVVTRDCPEVAVYGGIPARLIKKLDPPQSVPI
jgi:acetyltransferase-like isoleucine patch superfamily enzyme